MSERLVTFDLDGVLIDSREANIAAYAVAGVRMPEWAWGRPARYWLPGIVGHGWERVHVEKQRHYPACLRLYGRTLIGAVVARRLAQNGVRTLVVTNASFAGLKAAFDALGDRTWHDFSGGICGDKIGTLETIRPRCHVDDQTIPVNGVPIVPFQNDDLVKLYDAVRRYL